MQKRMLTRGARVRLESNSLHTLKAHTRRNEAKAEEGHRIVPSRPDRKSIDSQQEIYYGREECAQRRTPYLSSEIPGYP